MPRPPLPLALGEPLTTPVPAFSLLPMSGDPQASPHVRSQLPLALVSLQPNVPFTTQPRMGPLALITALALGPLGGSPLSSLGP